MPKAHSDRGVITDGDPRQPVARVALRIERLDRVANRELVAVALVAAALVAVSLVAVVLVAVALVAVSLQPPTKNPTSGLRAVVWPHRPHDKAFRWKSRFVRSCSCRVSRGVVRHCTSV